MLNTELQLKVLRKFSRPGKVVLRPVINTHHKYQKMKLRLSYHPWAFENEEECFVSKELNGPKISVIVPLYNTIPEHLLPMIYSVINQHYENWELILVNGSTQNKSKELIAKQAEIDTRIKIIDPGRNLGIAGNTNAGIAKVSGDFIAFLDHDDLLHPCALHSVVEEIIANKSEFIYTDEDKINHEGTQYTDPHLKPKWSPQLFENVNYINHLTVIKAEFVNKVKGLREKLDGAQDYDTLLRIIDKCEPKIAHIPRVLYHWRAADSSTAKDISNKTYIFKAGEQALNDHFSRKKIDADARAIKGKPGFYGVKYKNQNKFTIVIGSVGKKYARISAWWLNELLKKEKYLSGVELVVGDWYRPYAKHKNVKITFVADQQNYWEEVATSITNNNVICFQEAVLPRRAGSLSELIAISHGILGSIVSPVIIGKDEIIVDAGLVESDYGLQPLFKGCKYGESTFFGSTDWVRNVSSLTLDVFATNKDQFIQLIKNNTSAQKLTADLSQDAKVHSIVWAHTPCDYNGFLTNQSVKDGYFNQQLANASYGISMKVTSREGYDERDET
ncbi:hypothetical protein A3F37_00755 [Candidatus Saccharibacteria bacterium RIFCSPHIGHO2_12_FULL_41_12]|nr:MAG: hypothetical protein A3F37_00755 [Candidatus Saccharibacteria bacterium RIFCSPHIGHO2_12_FULL_41_12]